MDVFQVRLADLLLHLKKEGHRTLSIKNNLLSASQGSDKLSQVTLEILHRKRHV